MPIDMKLLDAVATAVVSETVKTLAQLDELIERYVGQFPEDRQAEARLRAVSMTMAEMVDVKGLRDLPGGYLVEHNDATGRQT